MTADDKRSESFAWMVGLAERIAASRPPDWSRGVMVAFRNHDREFPGELGGPLSIAVMSVFERRAAG